MILKWVITLLTLAGLIYLLLNGWLPFIAYIGVISGLTFLLFGYDKFSAKTGLRRIPEAALLSFSIIGGTLGALAGQLFFHHKTRKPYINRALAVIFTAQVLLIGLIAVFI